MAKRFTDSKKWNDDWFISLSNDYKVIWQWLLDNCSHAGLCKRSMALLNLMCRTSITEKELIDAMGGRVIIINDYWFIPKFIKFQYSTLLSCKPAIVSVVRELFENKCVRIVSESFGNDYTIVQESFNNYYEMIKDKVKDKDNKKKKFKRVRKSKEIDTENEKQIEKKENPVFEISQSVRHNEKTLVGAMMKVWLEKFPGYPEDTDKDYHALLNLGKKIAKAKGIDFKPHLEAQKQTILSSWVVIVGFVNSSDFYASKSLHTINNSWQSLYQEMGQVKKTEAVKQEQAEPKLKFN